MSIEQTLLKVILETPLISTTAAAERAGLMHIVVSMVLAKMYRAGRVVKFKPRKNDVPYENMWAVTNPRCDLTE